MAMKLFVEPTCESRNGGGLYTLPGVQPVETELNGSPVERIKAERASLDTIL
jgi:hypothetical protein